MGFLFLFFFPVCFDFRGPKAKHNKYLTGREIAKFQNLSKTIAKKIKKKKREKEKKQCHQFAKGKENDQIELIHCRCHHHGNQTNRETFSSSSHSPTSLKTKNKVLDGVKIRKQ
ncbi:hypothetical protein ES332_A11G147400v1 [Gossypium tomentosum]|uniref:Uncharacterized protein n=1 Tax=Gossypium tomentosum TaxID=34277 RepID=A0A5D2NAQ1_GOSTO|nr:hypothetical protein ES332_A11G147400v1 [Gossypium tomentosum]